MKKFLFTGRSIEAEKILAGILQGSASNGFPIIFVHGPSGTGKSTLVREVLTQAVARLDEPLVLLRNINPDEYSASEVFSALLKDMWYPSQWSETSSSNVPVHASLVNLTQGEARRGSAERFIYGLARASVGLIPVLGSLVKDALPSSLPTIGEEAHDASALFFQHIRQVSKQTPVVLAIDNVQYLTSYDQNAIAHFASKLPENLRLILIQRDDFKKKSVFETLVASRPDSIILELSHLDMKGVRVFLSQSLNLIGDQLETLARDCMHKTNGNLKEMEIYIRSLARVGNVLEPKNNVLSLLETVELLPRLSRSVLLIASLFPAGIRLSYLKSILNRISTGIEENEVSEALGELSAIGYLVVNSASGDLVRASHDRVIDVMRHIADAEDVEDLRAETVAVFREHVDETRTSTPDIDYLLHCLIGILSVTELSSDIHLLARLIDAESERGGFPYIVSLCNTIEYEELFALLPDAALRNVFDAFQKTSEFSRGLAFAERVRRCDGANRDVIDLCRARFLVQLNRNRPALEILDRLDVSPETNIVRANALQILCRDEEARTLCEAVLAKQSKTLEDYIVLRNAAHLYEPKAVTAHFTEALAFFRRRNLRYYEATVLSNWAVVSAWQEDFDKAAGFSRDALAIYQRIGSNDQCLTLNNLAMISAAKGEHEQAAQYLTDATAFTATTIRISDINIEGNRLVLRALAAGTVTKEDVIEYETLFLDKVLKLDDLWLQAQFRANLRSLQISNSGKSDMAASVWDDPFLNRGALTSVEIRRSLTSVSNGSQPVLLVLCPIWRY